MFSRILKLRFTKPRILQGGAPVKPTLKAAGTGVVAFNEFMSFMANIATLGALLFAVGGTASSVQGRGFVIDVGQMPFALRFLMVIAICAAIGWALGGIVAWLSDAPNETRQMGALVVAILLGCILIFTTDWIAASHRNIKLPELEILTVAGWAMALWIATFQFRRNARAASKSSQSCRAQALLAFSAVCPVLFTLSAIG